MNMSKPDEGSANITTDEWERIARYLTGEAGSSEAEATRRWIEEDPHRAKVVRLLESILVNVSHEDSSHIDVESALKHVKSRLEEPKIIPIIPRGARATPDRTFAALLRVAAATIIIFGGLMVWQRTRGEGTQTYATSVGERRQVVLKDGSKVLLGPTSRLVVPVMAPDEGWRMVILDGAAYFNVVHDPAHPFMVKVRDIVIRDVGTAFSVETDDSVGTRVAVDSGTVAVGRYYVIAQPGTVNRDMDTVLNARDKATVDTKGVAIVERSAVSDDDLAWTQGRLVFRDAPLLLVGAELYRWYGVRLRVADSSLANLHLTASFSGEPVDRVLNVIALSLGARIERQGNVAILHRAPASGARP
ncbi:MAG TPA: FecR domain-containing protein [Gemmatimonadaceae bacterium]|nr:FecR domain-containing protein [Gemmatimonadaceae bacterium]